MEILQDFVIMDREIHNDCDQHIIDIHNDDDSSSSSSLSTDAETSDSGDIHNGDVGGVTAHHEFCKLLKIL